MEVTGWITVHLNAATSGRDTDFTAKLTDVYPDGRSILLTDGTHAGPVALTRSGTADRYITLRAVLDRAILIFEGHFKRNYIHVRDVARAFHHGIDKFETMKQAGVFNVGLSDANISKWELCQVIHKHLL